MSKFCGNEDSRPDAGVKMGDQPKGGMSGGKVKYQGVQGLGPSGSGWKGAKDSRPKCTSKMGDGGR